jgi:hypothetical protein
LPVSILMLSTHLGLVLLSGLFPSGFPANNLYAFLVSPFHDTFPSHLILLDLVILIILDKKSKLWSSILVSFLQPPITFSVLGPNILLKHPLSVFLP